MKQFHHIFWFWLPPVGYMAAIFFMSSISQPHVAGEMPDYILHTLEYFLLALLLIRLLLVRQFLKGSKENLTTWRHACLSGVIIAVTYGISDEIHQYFVPGRYCSLYDMFSDTVGSLLAYAVASLDYCLLKRYRGWVEALKRFGAISSVSYIMYRCSYK